MKFESPEMTFLLDEDEICTDLVAGQSGGEVNNETYPEIGWDEF